MSIMTRIKESHVFQQVMRVLQFLSSIISLGLFSARLAKILRLARKAYTTSNGAVEGILAAAVLYTLLSMIIRCVLRKRASPTWLRWLWIVFDIAFIGAFIAVAEFTKPNGGTSGPCNKNVQRYLPNGTNCSLPWGTFILAILSTLLHAITAIFHEAKDHHHHHNRNQEKVYTQERSDMEEQNGRRHY